MSWEKLRGWPSGTSSCQRDQPPKCQRRLVAQDGFQGPPTKAPTTYRFGGNLVRTTFTVKRACVQDTLTKSHVDPHPPCSPSQRSWSVAPSELLLLCDRRDQETRPQITAWDLEKKKKKSSAQTAEPSPRWRPIATSKHCAVQSCTPLPISNQEWPHDKFWWLPRDSRIRYGAFGTYP